MSFYWASNQVTDLIGSDIFEDSARLDISIKSELLSRRRLYPSWPPHLLRLGGIEALFGSIIAKHEKGISCPVDAMPMITAKSGHLVDAPAVFGLPNRDAHPS